MDQVLLDTIVFDRLLNNPSLIPVRTRAVLEEAQDVFLSVVSLWELSNHIRDGRFVVSLPFEKYFKKALRTHQIVLLPIEWEAMEYMSTFDYQIIRKPYTKEIGDKTIQGVKTDLHKDTFDRLIIAHALTRNIPVISPDEMFPYYKEVGLRVIW